MSLRTCIKRAEMNQKQRKEVLKLLCGDLHLGLSESEKAAIVEYLKSL
jgi:hypothetical protein